MSREALLKKGICPRCGHPFRWIYQETIHGRTYLYAVHVVVEEGKKKRKKCYLGPADFYEYVSKTHDLEFYGLAKEDRYIRYLEEIIDLFDVDEPVSTDPEEFKKVFENAMRIKFLSTKIQKRSEERLKKIVQTMISDIKTSINLLKRDYSDNSQAQDLVKELEAFYEKIDMKILDKSFVNEETVRSYVERYLQLKNSLKIFNL